MPNPTDDDLTAERAAFSAESRPGHARLLAMLEAIGREPVTLPPGLVAETVALVLRQTEPKRSAARNWWLLDRRRLDVAVALGFGFLTFGLLLSGVTKLRDHSQRLACQDNLRGLHVALDGYADTHHGRLPEVGTPSVPRAGDFATELVRGGQFDATLAASCPAGDAAPYAYTFGYRPTPFAAVTGLRRDAGDDHTPVAADLPSRTAAPVLGAVSPHGAGQNVLYLGGNVRFATLATVGVAGDDIYRNDAGLVHAGLRYGDATLGRPNDTP